MTYIDRKMMVYVGAAGVLYYLVDKYLSQSEKKKKKPVSKKEDKQIDQEITDQEMQDKIDYEPEESGLNYKQREAMHGYRAVTSDTPDFSARSGLYNSRPEKREHGCNIVAARTQSMDSRKMANERIQLNRHPVTQQVETMNANEKTGIVPQQWQSQTDSNKMSRLHTFTPL